MIDVQQSAVDDIVEVKVIEDLTKSDFDHLDPVLKKHIRESSHPRLLLIMEAFSGWDDAAAFWKDLKMDTKYMGEFNRIAIVGDARWEEWLTRLVNPVTSAEMKFFEFEQITHARNWLRQE